MFEICGMYKMCEMCEMCESKRFGICEKKCVKFGNSLNKMKLNLVIQ